MRKSNHYLHGHCLTSGHSPTYNSWAAMWARCTNPKNEKYQYYSDRKICKRWKKFQNFLTDMGHRPAKHTLDRINNSKGYTPSNCKWSTQSEQTRHTKRNRYLTFQGQKRCLMEWSELTGIYYETIRARLKRGWSIEDTLTP